MTTIVPDGWDRMALRRHFLQVRRGLPRKEWERRNEALCRALAQWWQEWLSIAREGSKSAPSFWVGLYWPMKGEPDVRRVFAAWRWRALPAAVAPHAPLLFRPWQEEAPMITDSYGIPTPESAEVVRPEVLIVPLVAFDRQGYRLGYGGGFYDRTLAAWRAEGWQGIAVGVGFAFAALPDLHPEAHDVAMDVVVSDAGVVCDRLVPASDGVRRSCG